MKRALILSAALLAGGIAVAQAQDTTMSFFVTSAGSGKGADLGGLAGADAHCAQLAEAAGVTGKTWRAYLSAADTNAKDRIGAGPWYNAKGEKIADDVASLHSASNGLTKQTALDEKGNVIPGRGDTPNTHDILTGSQQDGTAVAGPDDATCGNWTSSADGQGGAFVGHTDLQGNPQGINFWNHSHKTPGCAPANLQRVGGAGLFYCFATN